MIRFALKCEKEHRFESWFQSGTAFDNLLARALVQCPDCGSVAVSKDLMAPKLGTTSGGTETVEAPVPVANAPDKELVDAIQKLRTHVEATSEYVGQKFASEARAMHLGDTPHRAIYGEVDKKEAKSLLEDGVPAMPLPFIPRQKSN
ncbi:MAG: DUF1178 family protein [Pseudomonadota bacterium]